MCITVLSGIAGAAAVLMVWMIWIEKSAAPSLDAYSPDLAETLIWSVPLLCTVAAVVLLLRNWLGIASAVRAFGLHYAFSIRFFAAVGVCELIVVDAFVAAGGSLAGIPPDAVTPLALTALVFPPIAYVYWSYGVLRSRETRDYFGLP